MISSVALNSMLHLQSAPSSSAEIEDLGHNAADSSTASHSHSNGGVTASPMTSYIYNVLRHSEKSDASDASTQSTKRRLSGDLNQKPANFDMKEFDEPFDRNSPSNVNTNPQTDAEIDAGDRTASPRDEKPLSGQGYNEVENFLEAQKTLHKLTSQLSGLGQRNPFQGLGALSPFLVAALQQQHQTLQQQLLNPQPQLDNRVGAYLNTALPFSASALRLSDVAADGAAGASISAASSAHNSPPFSIDDEDDELMYRRIEPEDLSLRERRSDIDETGSTTLNNWSWEEQFKQLYELSNDSERREWLNDWLSFMHRIGKPVTRIPIMAKQVLDLYELYRLVVQHGGLVEIINKKLWREITKGLNLPNSITSAAFTLRTQYQKYLYDYECDRENLSCLADLQAAIEGNKREGRRANPSDTPGPTISVSSHHTAGVSKAIGDVDLQHRNSAVFPYAALAPHSMAAFFGKGLNAFGADRDELSNELNNVFAAAGHSGVLPPLAQFELLQKAAINAAMAVSNLSNASNGASKSGAASTTGAPSLKCRSLTPPDNRLPAKMARFEESGSAGDNSEDSTSGRATRKLTRMKISADLDSGRHSMRISVEMNGQTFEGLLFATNGADPPLDEDSYLAPNRPISADGGAKSSDTAETISEN